MRESDAGRPPPRQHPGERAGSLLRTGRRYPTVVSCSCSRGIGSTRFAGAEAAVELSFENILRRGRRWRAGQGEEIGAAGHPAGGAALHRRALHLLIGEHAEQLAEALDLLLVDLAEGLRRHVAAGHPGAAGRDHHVDMRVGDPGLELRGDGGDVVAHDCTGGDPVAVARDQLGQGPAGLVVGLGARVGDGQDRDVDRKEGPALVNSCHSARPPAGSCRRQCSRASRRRRGRRAMASPAPAAAGRSSSWSAPARRTGGSRARGCSR